MTPPNTQPNPNATKVTYAGQADAQMEAEYRQKVEQNPGFANLVPNVLAYVEYKSKSAEYRENQERQLEQVVETYRPPMSTAGSFYLGYPHEQLKSMVTDNMAPSTANEQGEAWTKIGNTLVDLQNNLTKATEASKGEWQGRAADAAQGYFTGMASWSGNAAQGAQLTGNKLYEQSQAAETAKTSMPEPVKFSTADAYKMFFSEPNPFKWAETIDQIEQKFEEKQQAHERAAEVMTSMSTSFQQSGSTMPAFSPPPAMEGSGGTGDSTNPSQPGVGGRPTVPDGPGGIGGSGMPGGGSMPGGGGTGSNGGNLIQSGYTPGPGPVGPTPGIIPGPGPGNGYPGPGGNGWLPGGPGPGGRPPGPGQGGRPGLPGGGGSGGRSGGGGGLPGGGRGGMGGGPGGMAAAGGRGGFGPGGSAGAFGDTGRSGAGGFGPAGSGGTGAGGRGGVGGVGAGVGGMGAGAGRGQGDEDKEHKAASYLVETEDVFGDGKMVAPPVIGG